MRSTRMPRAIAAGSGTTDVIQLRESATFGFITPAALDSTAFTFTVCDTPTGTFVPLYDSAGAAPSITVTVSRAYAVVGAEADAVAPWPFVRLKGNASESAVREIVVLKK